MNKRNKIIYNVVTGVFTLHALFTIVAYFSMHSMTEDMFVALGVSATIIYPLAIAKFFGLVAIWTNKSRILKELAYLGFGIDFVLAIYLHINADHGDWWAPFVVLVLLAISYIYNRKLNRV